MIRRRLMMLKKSSGALPEGYTAVDYLQSSGVQWIEMGIAPNQNTKVVLKIMIHDFNNVYGSSLIGSRTDVNSNDQFVTYLDTYGGSRFLFRMDGQAKAPTFTGIKVNTFYTITLSGTEMKVEIEDGTVVFSETFSVSDFESTITMALFRSKNVDGSSYFKGKIYSCKHYNNGKLIQDFVPCLDTSGVPCLYDLISKTAFYNQGSGSFTWG